MRFVVDESPIHLAVLDPLPDSQRGTLIAAFDEAMRAHADDQGGVSFDAPYAVVSATRR